MKTPGIVFFIPVRDYDLAATFESGQAFRWHRSMEGWAGVVGNYWVLLVGRNDGIVAQCAVEMRNWDWLTRYLQVEVDLDRVLATFPGDEAMKSAMQVCRGLRLLRQDPWECLASFILSSTKRIVQIRQIVELLCQRFGEPITVPPGRAPAFAFPTFSRLAECSEQELRQCKMGFRAPNLKATAQLLNQGALDLGALRLYPTAKARSALINLPGVGQKIADCVLLFAYGFMDAFPMDVWVQRALRSQYFPRQRKTRQQLVAFTQTHFGPYAGYAQQYLFHSIRTGAIHDGKGFAA